MTLFDQLPLLPADPILGLVEKFSQDLREEKVDLSVGVYRDEQLATVKFGTVLEAEKKILHQETTKNYLPILGLPQYLRKSTELVFGKEIADRLGARIVVAQTVGATAALRIGCQLLRRYICSEIFVSEPTWPNHKKVAESARLVVSSYPYYDHKNHCIIFEELVKFLHGAKERSVILMHPSCHNPTGADLTWEQWKEILPIFQEKKLIPFFDMAYQGLGHGIDEDAYPIRLFAENDVEFLLATSYSKNFGLYGERVGCLFAVTRDHHQHDAIASVIKSMIREMYSNSPMHGAAIVAEILSNPDLRQSWLAEISIIRKRLQNIREQFTALLIKETGNDSLIFLQKRFGLFSFSGLTKKQVDRLMDEFGIYMTGNGRINISGMNQQNMSDVVEAIGKVSR